MFYNPNLGGHWVMNYHRLSCHQTQQWVGQHKAPPLEDIPLHALLLWSYSCDR